MQATAADRGLRLDVWLERALPELSRSRIQSLIKAGHITLGGRAAKPHARLRAGLEAVVRVPAARPVSAVAEAIPVAALYEDDDVIVVNKPAGLVVHPAAGHASGTLVNALLNHCADLAGIGGEIRPGIVHRLDKDTSGALVVAKNDAAMAGLIRQFKSGAVLKEYLALVWGTPQPPEGRLETLIGRSRHDRKKMSARPASGRPAVTHYAVQERLGDFSLMRIRIETGRTHQIRVHMAHMGHPVLGDTQYGRRRGVLSIRVSRQLLHAQRLVFKHPRTGVTIDSRAPLPPDFSRALDALRGQAALLDKRQPIPKDKPPILREGQTA